LHDSALWERKLDPRAGKEADIARMANEVSEFLRRVEMRFGRRVGHVDVSGPCVMYCTQVGQGAYAGDEDVRSVLVIAALRGCLEYNVPLVTGECKIEGIFSASELAYKRALLEETSKPHVWPPRSVAVIEVAASDTGEACYARTRGIYAIACCDASELRAAMLGFVQVTRAAPDGKSMTMRGFGLKTDVLFANRNSRECGGGFVPHSPDQHVPGAVTGTALRQPRAKDLSPPSSKRKRGALRRVDAILGVSAQAHFRGFYAFRLHPLTLISHASKAIAGIFTQCALARFFGFFRGVLAVSISNSKTTCCTYTAGVVNFGARDFHGHATENPYYK
jgi:hypothetical protein